MDQLPTVLEILGASSPALLRFDVGAPRPRYIGSASELEQKEDGSWILSLPGDAFVGREATPEACQWFRNTTEEEVAAVPALRVSRVPPRQLLPSKIRGSKVLAWAPDLAQFTVLATLPIDRRSSVEADGAREHRTVQLAALDGSLPFETRALHAGPRRVPASWLLARAPQTPEEAQVLATTAGAWGGRLLALSPAIATEDDLWPLYATDDGDAPGISSGPVRYARVRTVLEADGSLTVECSEGCALIWRWALPEALAFEDPVAATRFMRPEDESAPTPSYRQEKARRQRQTLAALLRAPSTDAAPSPGEEPKRIARAVAVEAKALFQFIASHGADPARKRLFAGFRSRAAQKRQHPSFQEATLSQSPRAAEEEDSAGSDNDDEDDASSQTDLGETSDEEDLTHGGAEQRGAVAGSLARCGLAFAGALLHTLAPSSAAAVLEAPLRELEVLPPFALAAGSGKSEADWTAAASLQLEQLQERLPGGCGPALRGLAALAVAAGAAGAALRGAVVILRNRQGEDGPDDARALSDIWRHFFALAGPGHFQQRPWRNPGAEGTGKPPWERYCKAWESVTLGQASVNAALAKRRRGGMEFQSFRPLVPPTAGVAFEVELLSLPDEKATGLLLGVATEDLSFAWGFGPRGPTPAEGFEALGAVGPCRKGSVLGVVLKPQVISLSLDGMEVGCWRLPLRHCGTARRILLRLPAKSSARLRLERLRQVAAEGEQPMTWAALACEDPGSARCSAMTAKASTAGALLRHLVMHTASSERAGGAAPLAVGGEASWSLLAELVAELPEGSLAGSPLKEGEDRALALPLLKLLAAAGLAGGPQGAMAKGLQPTFSRSLCRLAASAGELSAAALSALRSLNLLPRALSSLPLSEDGRGASASSAWALELGRVPPSLALTLSEKGVWRGEALGRLLLQSAVEAFASGGQVWAEVATRLLRLLVDEARQDKASKPLSTSLLHPLLACLAAPGPKQRVKETMTLIKPLQELRRELTDGAQAPIAEEVFESFHGEHVGIGLNLRLPLSGNEGPLRFDLRFDSLCQIPKGAAFEVRSVEADDDASLSQPSYVFEHGSQLPLEGIIIQGTSLHLAWRGGGSGPAFGVRVSVEMRTVEGTPLRRDSSSSLSLCDAATAELASQLLLGAQGEAPARDPSPLALLAPPDIAEAALEAARALDAEQRIRRAGDGAAASIVPSLGLRLASSEGNSPLLRHLNASLPAGRHAASLPARRPGLATTVLAAVVLRAGLSDVAQRCLDEEATDDDWSVLADAWAEALRLQSLCHQRAQLDASRGASECLTEAASKLRLLLPCFGHTIPGVQVSSDIRSVGKQLQELVLDFETDTASLEREAKEQQERAVAAILGAELWASLLDQTADAAALLSQHGAAITSLPALLSGQWLPLTAPAHTALSHAAERVLITTLARHPSLGLAAAADRFGTRALRKASFDAKSLLDAASEDTAKGEAALLAFSAALTSEEKESWMEELKPWLRKALAEVPTSGGWANVASVDWQAHRGWEALLGRAAPAISFQSSSSPEPDRSPSPPPEMLDPTQALEPAFARAAAAASGRAAQQLRRCASVVETWQLDDLEELAPHDNLPAQVLRSAVTAPGLRGPALVRALADMLDDKEASVAARQALCAAQRRPLGAFEVLATMEHFSEDTVQCLMDLAMQESEEEEVLEAESSLPALLAASALARRPPPLTASQAGLLLKRLASLEEAAWSPSLPRRGSLALATALTRLLRRPAALPALREALRSGCAKAEFGAVTVLSGAQDRVASLMPVVLPSTVAHAGGTGLVLSVEGGSNGGSVAVLVHGEDEERVIRLAAGDLRPLPMQLPHSEDLEQGVASLAIVGRVNLRPQDQHERLFLERWLGSMDVLLKSTSQRSLAVQHPEIVSAIAKILIFAVDGDASEETGTPRPTPALAEVELRVGLRRLFQTDAKAASPALSPTNSRNDAAVTVACSAGHRLVSDLQVNNSCDFCYEHRTHFRCARCDFDLCSRCWEERRRDEMKTGVALAIIGRHRSSSKTAVALRDMVVAQPLAGRAQELRGDLQRLRFEATGLSESLVPETLPRYTALLEKRFESSTAAVLGSADVPESLALGSDATFGPNGLCDAPSLEPEEEVADAEEESLLLVAKCDAVLSALVELSGGAAQGLFSEVWRDEEQREAILMRFAAAWDERYAAQVQRLFASSADAQAAAWASIQRALLLNLLDAVESPEESIEVETQHNYKCHQNVVFKVMCRSASRLRLTFDGQCHSSDQDTLSIFADAKLSRKLAACSGKQPGFGSVVQVYGNSAWFVWRSGSDRRRSDRDAGYWGWRMVVDVVQCQAAKEAKARESLAPLLRLLRGLPSASGPRRSALASLLLAVAGTESCRMAADCLNAIRHLQPLTWSDGAIACLRRLGHLASGTPGGAPALAAVVTLQLSCDPALVAFDRTLASRATEMPCFVTARGAALLRDASVAVALEEAMVCTETLEVPCAVRILLGRSTPKTGCAVLLGLVCPDGGEWWQQLNEEQLPFLLPGQALTLTLRFCPDTALLLLELSREPGKFSGRQAGPVLEAQLPLRLPRLRLRLARGATVALSPPTEAVPGTALSAARTLVDANLLPLSQDEESKGGAFRMAPVSASFQLRRPLLAAAWVEWLQQQGAPDVDAMVRDGLAAEVCCHFPAEKAECIAFHPGSGMELDFQDGTLPPHMGLRVLGENFQVLPEVAQRCLDEGALLSAEALAEIPRLQSDASRAWLQLVPLRQAHWLAPEWSVRSQPCRTFRPGLWRMVRAPRSGAPFALSLRLHDDGTAELEEDPDRPSTEPEASPVPPLGRTRAEAPSPTSDARSTVEVPLEVANALVLPEPPEAWEPSLGEAVVLSRLFEGEADASGGPLRPGDVGRIIAVQSRDRLPLQVQSSSGAAWWYTFRALVPTSSLRPGLRSFRWTSLKGAWRGTCLCCRLSDGAECWLSSKGRPAVESEVEALWRNDRSKELLRGCFLDAAVSATMLGPGDDAEGPCWLFPCRQPPEEEGEPLGVPSTEQVVEVLRRPLSAAQTVSVTFIGADGTELCHEHVRVDAAHWTPRTLFLAGGEYVEEVTPACDFVVKSCLPERAGSDQLEVWAIQGRVEASPLVLRRPRAFARRNTQEPRLASVTPGRWSGAVTRLLGSSRHLVETGVVFLHGGGFGEGKLCGYLLRQDALRRPPDFQWRVCHGDADAEGAADDAGTLSLPRLSVKALPGGALLAELSGGIAGFAGRGRAPLALKGFLRLRSDGLELALTTCDSFGLPCGPSSWMELRLFSSFRCQAPAAGATADGAQLMYQPSIPLLRQEFHVVAVKGQASTKVAVERLRGSAFLAWLRPGALGTDREEELSGQLPLLWPPTAGVELAWHCDGSVIAGESAPANAERSWGPGNCLKIEDRQGTLHLLRDDQVVWRSRLARGSSSLTLALGFRGPSLVRLEAEDPHAGAPAASFRVRARPGKMSLEALGDLQTEQLEGFLRLLHFPSPERLQPSLEALTSSAKEGSMPDPSELKNLFGEDLNMSSSEKLCAILRLGMGARSGLKQALSRPLAPSCEPHCGEASGGSSSSTGVAMRVRCPRKWCRQATVFDSSYPESRCWNSERHFGSTPRNVFAFRCRRCGIAVSARRATPEAQDDTEFRGPWLVEGEEGAEIVLSSASRRLQVLEGEQALGLPKLVEFEELEPHVWAAPSGQRLRRKAAALLEFCANGGDRPRTVLLIRKSSSTQEEVEDLEQIFETLAERGCLDSAKQELHRRVQQGDAESVHEAFRGLFHESVAAKWALLVALGASTAPLLAALGAPSAPWADALLPLKRLLLPAVTKKRFFEQLRASESRPAASRVSLNSIGAQRFKARRTSDPLGRASLFGQLWQKLRTWSPWSFRLPRGDFAFSVEFEGEGGEDAGGLYRAALDMAIRDVQSSFLPLMAPTPNNRENSGDYRDCWMLSPDVSSAGRETLSMLRFLGAILGLALRTGSLLPLSWPPALWRSLVGDPRSLDDVRSIDVHAYQVICSVAEDPQLVSCLSWSCPDVLGRPQDLRRSSGQGDASEDSMAGHVENSEVEDFIKALLQSRLEGDLVALEALKGGLALIVPLDMLRLWTWQDLQRAICGEPHLEISLLRAQTVYTNCTEASTIVTMFWETLGSFSEAEKERFLRFVWGRTRLPVEEEWEQKFQLAAVAADDARLPTSHTCFFQLDLPRYSSRRVLAERLRFAMDSCVTIDSDGAPRSMANWAEDAMSEEEGWH